MPDDPFPKWFWSFLEYALMCIIILVILNMFVQFLGVLL